MFRSAKVVKGGKNFAFEALVAAGDKQGNIGIRFTARRRKSLPPWKRRPKTPAAAWSMSR